MKELKIRKFRNYINIFLLIISISYATQHVSNASSGEISKLLGTRWAKTLLLETQEGQKLIETLLGSPTASTSKKRLYQDLVSELGRPEKLFLNQELGQILREAQGKLEDYHRLKGTRLFSRGKNLSTEEKLILEHFAARKFKLNPDPQRQNGKFFLAEEVSENSLTRLEENFLKPTAVTEAADFSALTGQRVSKTQALQTGKNWVTDYFRQMRECVSSTKTQNSSAAPTSNQSKISQMLDSVKSESARLKEALSSAKTLTEKARVQADFARQYGSSFANVLKSPQMGYTLQMTAIGQSQLLFGYVTASGGGQIDWKNLSSDVVVSLLADFGASFLVSSGGSLWVRYVKVTAYNVGFVDSADILVYVVNPNTDTHGASLSDAAKTRYLYNVGWSVFTAPESLLYFELIQGLQCLNPNPWMGKVLFGTNYLHSMGRAFVYFKVRNAVMPSGTDSEQKH